MAYDSVAGLFIAFAGLLLVTASAPVLRFAERSMTVAPQVSYGMMIWLLRIMGVILFILGVVTWRMIV
ncbi:MAG: hypothetical protein ACR2IE_00195 [Candidatus Sumerlaeaceae bacterium]